MTANAMAGAREEFLAAGMSDYISKPVQPAALFALLARIPAAGKNATLAPSAGAAMSAALPLSINGKTYGLPAIDVGRMVELEKILSRDKLDGLLSLYRTDIALHLAGIANRSAEGDIEGVSREAHIIVGSSGNFGAIHTCALARRLEAACRDGNRELSRELVGELSESCKVSSAALQAWSDSRPASASSSIAG